MVGAIAYFRYTSGECCIKLTTNRTQFQTFRHGETGFTKSLKIQCSVQACGNSACRNTFICHYDKKKYCSNRCYPSVLARAAAKQAGRNGALAGAANCASLDTAITTPAHTPAPTYYESPDDTSTRKTGDE
ncbi:hypothetical protein DAPPUDRAFT_116952 [Daphnia pulex]|uniref:Uncharacterized protein n=1 Tax=Daphnia pulex TaxID=6669 RepID=E9HR23_DAPPU|nr:hypothetical protein DAPPUDRAFT_116952 [Daphnia pulex]|eukprot:EFX65812.1 hypothetical protein DAPPUDRAFT_116952 [Daphnia pulex]